LSISKKVREIVKDWKYARMGTIGSHSALELAYGAHQEGFETVVVCQIGREKTYTKRYRNLFDHIILVDKFADIVREENIRKLLDLNTVFVPNRSFSTYVPYDLIEQQFRVAILGNRQMLRTEERNEPRNQRYLLEKAGILIPKTFSSPQEIDRLVIVKVPEKKRPIERAFFLATSNNDFVRKTEILIRKDIIAPEALEKALIEEYVLGAKFNANFFWSPLSDTPDLLGFDQRIESNIDGFLDLPAEIQLELGIPIQNVQVGHVGVTMRESQLEKIFETAEKFIEICKVEYPPGIIGLFSLQGAMTKDLDFYVFDVSPRSPGCPCVEPTSPYMKYKYGFAVGPGRRVAMEIKQALATEKLAEIVT